MPASRAPSSAGISSSRSAPCSEPIPGQFRPAGTPAQGGLQLHLQAREQLRLGPLQPLQGRPEQLQRRDRRRHRIPRQTEERHPRHLAPGEGTAGLEEQLPEAHLPQLRHQGANPVAVAGGDAAGAYHHIAASRQLEQGAAQRLRLVDDHPQIGDGIPQARQQRRQQRRIALPDLAGRTRLPRRQQFITADQQANPRPAAQPQLRHPAAGQSSQVRHAEPPPRRHQLLAGGRLLLGATDPGVGSAGLQQRQLLTLHRHQLLGQHARTALRHHGSGEDPHRFTGGEHRSVGSTGGGHPHQSPAGTRLRWGRSGNGVAIHDRGAEPRHRRRRANRRRRGAAEGLGQRQRLLQGQGLQRLEDQLPGSIERQAFTAVGIRHRVASHHGGRHSYGAGARPEWSSPDRRI